ncbi:MAG: hypothetical protein GY820_04925 [Gammaproteobacteria bacterium]|nr:hypothetical protein [Gammaproteobacteria bacterium]
MRDFEPAEQSIRQGVEAASYSLLLTSWSQKRNLTDGTSQRGFVTHCK